jgi:hypothetical protein
LQAAKTEELQDLMVDLEVKEAGFNNSFRETAEGHKVSILCMRIHYGLKLSVNLSPLFSINLHPGKK